MLGWDLGGAFITPRFRVPNEGPSFKTAMSELTEYPLHYTSHPEKRKWFTCLMCFEKGLKMYVSVLSLFYFYTSPANREHIFSPHWYQKVKGRPLWTAILSSCSYTWMRKSSYISDKCSQIHVPICKIHILQSIFFSNKVDILTPSI